MFAPGADALIPSLGDASPVGKVAMYVASVEHQLGRTTGFVTTVTGVAVDDDPWDTHTPLAGAAAADDGSTAAASPAADAANAVRGGGCAASVRRATGVGEVRAVTTKGDTANNAAPPSQTETVWEGLVPADGRPNGARRLPSRDRARSPRPA